MNFKYVLCNLILCVGITAYHDNVKPKRLLGCAYDNSLCLLQDGGCMNDGLFGVCHGGGPVWYYLPTDEEYLESRVLVTNLLSSGFMLSSDYSQCILWSAVSAYRNGDHIIDVHLDVCNFLSTTEASTLDIESQLFIAARKANAIVVIANSRTSDTSSRQYQTAPSNLPSSFHYDELGTQLGNIDISTTRRTYDGISRSPPSVGLQRVNFSTDVIVVYIVCGVIGIIAIVSALFIVIYFYKKSNLVDSEYNDKQPVSINPLRSFTSPVKPSCIQFQEPVDFYMDSVAVTNILAYMEKHLKNKHMLSEEWSKLCSYQPNVASSVVARDPGNASKNYYSDESLLPYEHTRIRLNTTHRVDKSDYINASRLTDSDPHSTLYIVTQHPLRNTVADFWQMVWEQKCTIIVNLTSIHENVERYWSTKELEPAVYGEFEVKMLQERIWCNEFVVRNFIVMNKYERNGSVSVVQFHFTAWPENSLPASPKTLLDFRRAVIESFHGRANPIIVHCSDGIGRSGTYCLIGTVLSRLRKGAKELDVLATLEHLRDQRPKLVLTKEQYQFAFSAIVQELQAFKRSY